MLVTDAKTRTGFGLESTLITAIDLAPDGGALVTTQEVGARRPRKHDIGRLGALTFGLTITYSVGHFKIIVKVGDPLQCTSEIFLGKLLHHCGHLFPNVKHGCRVLGEELLHINTAAPAVSVNQVGHLARL